MKAEVAVLIGFAIGIGLGAFLAIGHPTVKADSIEWAQIVCRSNGDIAELSNTDAYCMNGAHFERVQ